MKCSFCSKHISNLGGLAVHEKYGCKLNPNKIDRTSNFIGYNKKVKDGLVEKEFKNHYSKANLTGNTYVVSDETKRKISEASKKQIWSNERKERHSIIMSKTVKKYPDSYSAKNVCGRTKKIEYNGFYLTGKWEYDVAVYLDNNRISWTNKLSPFEYQWKGKLRNYFPDFYLIDFNLFIEVKGYETDRDRAKWSVVTNIFIIKKKEMKDIWNNFPLFFVK